MCYPSARSVCVMITFAFLKQTYLVSLAPDCSNCVPIPTGVDVHVVATIVHILDHVNH